MLDIVQKALAARRESKYIEFKDNFDPSSAGDWCEIVKDIVAIANSGGGIIVFGLDSSGTPTGASVAAVASIDPADVGNKVSKYTGPVQLEFEARELEKQGKKLHAYIVQAVSVPVVFQKPGTYEIGAGRQKAAFSVGTVYFRHGAKSEPGNSDDIRAVIERQLESIRKSWIRGVRKVVQAPEGSQILTVRPAWGAGAPSLSPTVRAVKDPNATPVLLTRDRQKAEGFFVHEEVSEGIFDEINNVIDANRALARGQQQFFLGPQIYYRVYAERQHVLRRDEDMSLLLRSAIDLYAPGLFWALSLPETAVAETFAELYLHPRSPMIHCLLRLALLLGTEFCDWLHGKWHSKWQRYSQPPAFYFSFDEMRSTAATVDPCIAAARLTANAQVRVDDLFVGVGELIESPQKAASLLSTACMRVFEGHAEMRPAARALDYFAYGLQVRNRAPGISRAIIRAVGDQEPGDLGETTTAA
jgi:hypothetical protein